ncbi:ABC transporter permease [Haloarculaceae archaeon H-GB2-1]|nr:ABC transporter permease [Haloarculaceae archaeon H-GB11]MEA5410117.1 ABC transporter permease [Haloarculaceae archaeon H-GB2-1]
MARRGLRWRFPSWMLAWRNFKRNTVRSALAALGIVIGVVAIASLGMVGAAIQYSTTENLGSLTNQVTVTSGTDNPNDGLTETDVRDLEQVAVDEIVVPQKSNATTLEGNGTERRVRVVGVTRASALYSATESAATEGESPDRLRSGALVTPSSRPTSISNSATPSSTTVPPTGFAASSKPRASAAARRSCSPSPHSPSRSTTTR